MIPGIIPKMPTGGAPPQISFSETRTGTTQNFADFATYPTPGDVLIMHTYSTSIVTPSSGNPSVGLTAIGISQFFPTQYYYLQTFYCVVQPGQTHCNFSSSSYTRLVHYITDKSSVSATVEQDTSIYAQSFTVTNTVLDAPCILYIGSRNLDGTNGTGPGLDYYGRQEGGNLVASYGFTNTGGGSMTINQSQGYTYHVYGVLSLS